MAKVGWIRVGWWVVQMTAGVGCRRDICGGRRKRKMRFDREGGQG